MSQYDQNSDTEFGANIVDLKCRVFGDNPLQRSGSGLEPDPELNRKFGPVANTTLSALH
jgi:hypothetical protein